MKKKKVPNSKQILNALSPKHSHSSLMMKIYWCKSNFPLALNELAHVKFLEDWLAHSKHSISISKHYFSISKKTLILINSQVTIIILHYTIIIRNPPENQSHLFI